MHYSYIFTKEALQSESSVEVLQADRSEVAEELTTADVVVPLMQPLPVPALQTAKRLKLIIQFGVGLEGVNVEEATRLGIYVCRIPSHMTANAPSCAEHALYLALAVLRNHNQMETSIRNKRLGVPLGQTLLGKNCLVLGYGGICRELLPRLNAFKPSAVHVVQRRAIGGDDDHTLPSCIDRLLSWSPHSQAMKDVFGQADIIFITVNQSQDNIGMVNYSNVLQYCKHGVILINVARGGLLDYDSIKRGLDEEIIGGLGLDVYFNEPVDLNEDLIAQHPRVYLTPHIAGVTERSYRGMADIVAQEVLNIKSGAIPSGLVNHDVLLRTHRSSSSSFPFPSSSLVH